MQLWMEELCKYLYVSDEGHGDPFLKLIQRGVKIKDLYNLKNKKKQCNPQYSQL